MRQVLETWMRSQVTVEKRWGSWAAMMDMDTSGVSGDDGTRDEEMAEFARECYVEEHEKWTGQGAEGWWQAVKATITTADVREAIASTKKGTSPGPSGITTDMLADLGDAALEHVAELFDQCLREGHIPDEMNCALMTLLPKTSEGLSNLSKTRPIALMEILTKVYERIIMGRIVKVLEEHKMLNLAQYGGLAKMGTAAPLRVMTNVLEHA